MMLAAAQMFFLAALAGAVVWLVYLARQQDAAGSDGFTPAPRGTAGDRLFFWHKR